MSRTFPHRCAAAFGAIVLLAGCGSADSGSESGTFGPSAPGAAAGASATRDFAADNGTVKIPTNPQRIIATGYAVPTLIESDAKLVGISEWTRALDFFAPEDRKEYDNTPKISGDLANSINYEAVAKAKPDLIIIGVPKPVLGDVDLKKLQAIAPTIALGPDVPSAWRELQAKHLDAANDTASIARDKAAYTSKAAALKAKWAGPLRGVRFGHLGAYAEKGKGQFQREFAGSTGTNIAGDVGLTYPGSVANPGKGSLAVSEFPSMEQLPNSFKDVDVITYTVESDGSRSDLVTEAQNSPLWKNLPQVKSGYTIPLRDTQAATYKEATVTLGLIDEALSKAKLPPAKG